MSEQGEIQQRITEAKYAATSATGDATISITNYYYREEARGSPAEFGEADDGETLPCPYRGLFHFGPNDAEVFFGREIFIEELYGATKTRNFIPVLGASGSGKSSVVLAGLVPKLQKEGDWQFTHFRPGSDPFHALAEALVPLYEPDKNTTEQMYEARQLAKYVVDGSVPLQDVFSQIERNYPHHRVLLIADQFEELYTRCTDRKIHHHFLDTLLDSFRSSSSQRQSSHVLVTTMRADFLGNALAYPRLADRLRSADIKIRSMNREELASVIEKPVQKLGVTFQEGLVERILEDVEDQPGNLPLLEFALTELWNQRTGKQLTHQIYEEIGQVEGALARYADEKYGNLTDDEKEKVRHIFIQLVRPGEGTEDTRRIAMKGELGEQSWSLVKQLADDRLVVTSRNATHQETVEVVHEALIRNWGELRDWMNTDRVFRAWQERLRSAKRQWEATNQDPGSLLRGAALAEAEEKLAERPDDLISEKEFIQQSIQERDRLAQKQKERDRQELESKVALETAEEKNRILSQANHKATQRIRLGYFVLAISLVGAVIAGTMVTKQREELLLAKLERGAARVEYLLTNQNPTNGLVLAIGVMGENLEILPKEIPSSVQSSLYKAMEIARESNIFKTPREVNFVGFSPDKQHIAVANCADFQLWDIETGKPTKTFKGHQACVRSIAFSSDGRYIVSGSNDHIMYLWDVDGDDETISSDGREIEIIRPIRTFEGHTPGLRSDTSHTMSLAVAFSPDDQHIASGSDDNTVRLWQLDGTQIGEPFPHDDEVSSVAFSPDGQYIISGSCDNKVRLWNIESGQLEGQPFTGHTDCVTTVAFSPDGQYIVSGSDDNTLRLWDIKGNIKGKPFTGHQARIWSVAFSPDSQYIVSGSFDRTIRLWNLHGKLMGEPFRGHTGSVSSVDFSPDGHYIVSGGDWPDDTVRFWDIKQGDLINQPLGKHDAPVTSVAFSPDGKYIVSGSFSRDDKESFTGPDGDLWIGGNHILRLWNRQGHPQGEAFIGHYGSEAINNDLNMSVAFSSDSQQILSGSGDWTVRLWTLDGTEIGKFPHEDSVTSVDFHPDNKSIFVSADFSGVHLWDVEKQMRSTLVKHNGYASDVSFSPDGEYIASGSAEGRLYLFDLDGNQIGEPFDHEAGITSVAFSPNGEYIVTGSYDGTIRLWDRQGNLVINSFLGDEGSEDNFFDPTTYSVAFSPNGKQIVSGGSDGTIKLWDTQGNLIGFPFQGDQGDVYSVAFSPDGREILSGGEDGTVRLWQASGQEWLTVGCNRLQNHPVLKTPKTEEQKQARETCEKYVWSQEQ